MRTRSRRGELARALAVRLNISERFARRIVGELIELLEDELAAGRDVDLRGFGRFKLSTWAARRLPTRGGGSTQLPARRCVKFRAGDTLKRKVRGEE